MAIHSIGFLFFTAAVCAAYYAVPRRHQNTVLLVASYGFYAAISVSFAAVLAVVTAVNYALGIAVEGERPRRRLLAAGLAVNVGVFLLFKSSDFFVPEFRGFISLMGGRTQTEGFALVLPVGLSFYVLQCISYLVDVSRRQTGACRNILTFALYLAWFPKLTAGPIERARTFIPRLESPRTVDNDLAARSTTLVVIGLFRKIVVADTILLAVPPGIFSDPASYSSPALACWIAAYTLGIYNDFCGYTNIVRGVSGWFGIELSANFRQPVFSRNFSELWTRWHITLSMWLRDYVYFPLSRALVRRSPGMKNPAAIMLPPLVTMLASGLWHGPKLSYLSWGAVMGAYLAVENFIASRRRTVALDDLPLPRQIANMAAVFTLALVSVVFFLYGPAGATAFFGALLTNLRPVLPESRVFLLLLPALAIDVVQYRTGDETAFASMGLPAKVPLLAGALLCIIAFSQSKLVTPFIYQGF
jgi:D-alanyl-lipoteichoic acid acyltransferase DltB (MBOAT superfamily)